MKDLINGFKKLLANFDIVDAGECDENLIPTGSTALQITAIAPVNPAISDAVVSISFTGMTLADSDPDKSIVNALFSDLDRALGELTLADIAEACSCQAELFYPTGSTPPTSGAERIFSINYNLVIQNFNRKE